FRKIDWDKIVNKENAFYGCGLCPLETLDFFQLSVGTVEVNARLTSTSPDPAFQPRRGARKRADRENGLIARALEERKIGDSKALRSIQLHRRLEILFELEI